MRRALYPVFLDLEGRPVVVVGGGAAAERRVERLLEAGASITLVAPRPTDGLRRRAEAGQIRLRERPFRAGDLAGARLVVAERLDAETAARVFEEAEARGIFASVEDDLEHLSFHHPSVLRRGALTVAISTEGRAPALAARLRQRLERSLGPEHARFLELAGRLRRPLAERCPDLEERRARWYRLVDSEVLALLAAGREEEAVELSGEILGVAPGAAPDTEPARGEEMSIP